MPELSPAQRRVLEWLRAYPGVKLGAYHGGVTWTAMWADGAARRSLGTIMGDLIKAGVFEGDIAPVVRPRDLEFLDWGTPRCSVKTFRVLYERGYLRKVSGHMNDPFGGYYVLSDVGLAALQSDRERGVLVQPERREERGVIRRCECGQELRSIGGHYSGPRHLEWLRLQAYRAEILG